MTQLEHEFLIHTPKLLRELIDEVKALRKDVKEVTEELKKVKGEK